MDARSRAELDDGFVERSDHLVDLGLFVIEMARGPVGEDPARALDDVQPADRVGRLGNIVERLTDFRREHGVLHVGLRHHVARRPYRFRVAGRPIPVNVLGGEVDQLQFRIGEGRRGRHREDHAVADARRLSVTDERSAVGEKHAKKNRLIVSGGCGPREQPDSHERDGQPASFHEVPSVRVDRTNVK